MSKYIKAIFFVCLMCILGINGCEPYDSDYPTTIIFKNTTNADISLLSFTINVKNDIPVTIQPKKQVVVNLEFYDGFTVTFLFKGKKNYVCSSPLFVPKEYTLQFSEDAQRGIECLEIITSWPVAGKRLLPIGEVED